MDQFLQSRFSSGLSAIVISLLLGVGIAILYVRYLRRLRTPPHERTSVDTYGLLIFGVITIIISLSGLILLFSAYRDLSTIIVFVLSLLVFTALFVFSAKRSYKKSS